MSRKDVMKLVFVVGMYLVLWTMYLISVSKQQTLQTTLNQKEKVISDMEESLNIMELQVENLTEAIQVLDAKFVESEERNQELETENKKLHNKVNILEEQKKEIERKVPPATTTSRGSSASSYVGKELTVTATAYTAYCQGCSGITATGINLRNNPHAKVIAVDPNVIPLGSRVWVEGYGEAIAGDTGGAIKGNIIDVHVPTKDDAYQWGRRFNVKVKILS